MVKVVKHCNMSRVVVEASNLETSKVWLDRILNNLNKSRMSLLTVGPLEQMTFKDLFQPKPLYVL